MTSERSQAARALARRLLAGDGLLPADPADPEAAAANLERACARASANLRRTVGDDGYAALLARALKSTELEHPALVQIRRADDAGIHLDAVVASVRAHGIPAVTAALESLLAALIDILGGLIGEDMVLSLLDVHAPSHQTRTEKETA